MTRIVGAALVILGLLLLVWAGYSAFRSPAHYSVALFETSESEAKAFESLNLFRDRLQRIEIRSPEERRPVATGVVARDGERLAPLMWRNEVTEPVFFADETTADVTKVLAAIREHTPQDAVLLAWWDLSRAIRIATGRDAPLDDPLARGLLLPAAWPEAPEAERKRWGAGVDPKAASPFEEFIGALVADEANGAARLAHLAAGKPAYIVVHISDVWKAAAAAPDRISVAYKDFASSGLSHGVIKSATQWMREEKIDGGFAVEPMGGATRLHYFKRNQDGATLLAKMLPFSTSNPARLERLELVYQHKGWWIYRLKS
jgi:hydroxylamine oxidation protein HaoB